jgi:Asp/Glu/hydantoin racemase
MRIRWQSFLDPSLNESYFRRLTTYLNSISADDATVEVIGMRPQARDFGRLQEFRCASIAIANAIQAEKDGIDVFVIGHFQEPGLYEARSSCNIPIVGLGEATVLWGSHLGRRLGLISVDDVFEVIHHEQMGRYGLESRIVGISAINSSVDEFELAFSGDAEMYSNILEKFKNVAIDLIHKGADVIVPAGGLFGLLTSGEKDFKIGVIPVVPCIAIALGWSELAAKLHRNQGVTASRGPSFSKSSEQAIRDFLDK